MMKNSIFPTIALLLFACNEVPNKNKVLDDKILKLKADLNNTKYKLQSVSILEDSEPPEHNRKMNEKTVNVNFLAFKV